MTSNKHKTECCGFTQPLRHLSDYARCFLVSQVTSTGTVHLPHPPSVKVALLLNHLLSGSTFLHPCPSRAPISMGASESTKECCLLVSRPHVPFTVSSYQTSLKIHSQILLGIKILASTQLIFFNTSHIYFRI